MNEVVVQIIGALSAGAIAAGTEVAGDAVKTAYNALKTAVKSLVGEDAKVGDQALGDNKSIEESPELKTALSSLSQESITKLTERVEALWKEIYKNTELVDKLKSTDQRVNIMVAKGGELIFRNMKVDSETGIALTVEGRTEGGDIEFVSKK